MTKTLLALYRTPPDPAAFHAHYNAVHLPLVHLVPGLVRAEVTMIDRTLMGDPGAYMLATLVFADEASFRMAMKSPENAAVGADLANFATGIVTIMTGTVQD